MGVASYPPGGRAAPPRYSRYSRGGSSMGKRWSSVLLYNRYIIVTQMIGVGRPLHATPATPAPSWQSAAPTRAPCRLKVRSAASLHSANALEVENHPAAIRAANDLVRVPARRWECSVRRDEGILSRGDVPLRRAAARCCRQRRQIECERPEALVSRTSAEAFAEAFEYAAATDARCCPAVRRPLALRAFGIRR